MNGESKMNNNHNNKENISISELNNYRPKRTNFTYNPSGSKPFDINKMTGNTSNEQPKDKGEEK